MNFKLSFFLIFIIITIKLLAIYFTKFNLFGDEAQYWIWSQKVDFGYYSKPPFLAWVIRFFTFFLGSSFEALKLIPYLLYFLTTYVVYVLSLELYKKQDLALITAISFYLIPAVTVSSFLLSTDVVLVLFWSLCLLFLLRIRNNPKKIYFLILGIFLGLAFLTKYAAIYFIISFFILIILDSKIRKVFMNNIYGFLMFVFALILVISPNILWNLKQNWVTLDHTLDNAAFGKINLNIFQGVEFLISQIIMLGPVISLTFFLIIKKTNYNFQTIFLLCFSLPIFLIVLIEAILVRANANWAAVALIPFFVLIMSVVFDFSKKILIINNLVNFIFCLIFYLLIAYSYPLNVFDRINGIDEFSNFLEDKYLKNKEYLIVEDRLIYSNLRYELKNLDIIILNPHNPAKKIKNHFQLSDPLLPSFNNNFLFIGNPQSINYIINSKTMKILDQKKVLFSKNDLEIYEVIF